MIAETNWSGSLYYAGLLFSIPVAFGTYSALSGVVRSGHPVPLVLAVLLAVVLAGTTAISMLGATGLDK